MKITNNYGLPASLQHAANASMYDKGDADVSVTELINPPRISLLSQKYDDKITVDVRDMALAMLGTAFHSLMSEAAAFEGGVIVEERIFIEVLGVKVSGQIDRQIVKKGYIDIEDFKVTSVSALRKNQKDISAASTLKECPDWVQQLNLYAFLASKSKKLPIGKMSVIAYLRDWSKMRAQADKNYPQAPFVTVPIKLYSETSIYKYLLDRVRAFQAAKVQMEMTGEPTPCLTEETWADPDQWRSPSSANVVGKLFKSEKEAFAWFDGLPPSKKATLYPQLRMGERKRCKHYCPVSAHCSQWANLKKEFEEKNKSIAAMANMVSKR